MTAPAKISLAQQIESVRFAETRQRVLAQGGAVKGLRGPTVEAFDLQRLNAAARTLETLARDADAIRAFLTLPEDARQAVLQHAATMAGMCLELAKREAIAKQGGPVR